MKGIKPPATAPDTQAQVRFNEDSLSDKHSEVGLNYFYMGGLIGPVDTAQLIPQWTPILIININAAVQYVAMSADPAMLAPVGGATGIPIAPNGGSMVLSSGPNNYIRSSSADVFAYAANDNVVNVDESGLKG